MANKTIIDYIAAGTIDASSDKFLLWQNSTNTYKKINRNTIMGVNGQPADLSTVQTFTNKVIGNTNTVTVKDTLFTLQDDSDTTKQGRFQLSGLTTATTRTYTLPDASSTLADLSTTQTFTNKTLTSPVIIGGSIANTAITVDSISEFTSGNGVTVSGLNIKSGKLNSNNSVVTSNITDGVVTPNKLVSGTGTGWAWTTWSPTLTNLSGGTINYAKYIQIGNTVFYRFKYTLAGAGVSGSVSFTLPVTANADYGPDIPLGEASLVDNGVQLYRGFATPSSTTTAVFKLSTVSGSNVVGTTNLSSTVPFTWATGDYLITDGSYEAA